MGFRYPRALFVTPAYPGGFFGGVRPPLGIAYVEETVADAGVITSAVDMNATRGTAYLQRKIAEFRPDIIGLTMMTYQYATTYALIGSIKSWFPAITIVVGGAHVSAIGGRALDECTDIDYVVAGEGEIAMRSLCIGEPIREIAGLFYRKNDKSWTGRLGDRIPDLDALPFPRYRSYPLEKYTAEIEISTSRGCPHSCIFCQVPGILGSRIRYRSAGIVGDELEYFWKQGIRSFQFADDNFLANRKRFFQLMDEIRHRGLSGTVLRCGQGIRADLINHEVLIALKSAGFRQIGIGVESGSDKVLQAMGKRLSVSQSEAAVKLACDHGFDVTLLFVVGTPGETLDDVRKSIALAKKYPVMKAFFFNLIPFPGTALFDWVTETQCLADSYATLYNRVDEWKLRAEPFFSSPELTYDQRKEALSMTARASRDIQVNTLKRKLRRLGPLAHIVAQAGRVNGIERFFVSHRWTRRLLDHLFWGRQK